MSGPGGGPGPGGGLGGLGGPGTSGPQPVVVEGRILCRICGDSAVRSGTVASVADLRETVMGRIQMHVHTASWETQKAMKARVHTDFPPPMLMWPRRHVHYGGHCCFSCKAFFRRAVNWQNKNNRNFQCKFENKCEITIKNRKTCQSCRFQVSSTIFCKE